MDGLSEASGVERASGDVVVEVAEAEGDAPEGLGPAVDGLGGAVRAVGVVEEREHVAHAAFEGTSERGEFGASGRTAFDAARDSMSSAIMPRPLRRSSCV